MEGIVVGVDRSAAAAAAVDWALAEGVRRDRPVTVVHTWVDAVTAGFALQAVAGGSDVVADDALALAQEVLKDARARVPRSDGVDARAVALRGGAAPVLAEASRGADLMVVGTRGAGALSRAVLGSVSAAVLHHAHCPVVVVPEARPWGHRAPRVVVGVDHSPASLAAVAWARQHAERRGVALVPVHAWQPTDPPADPTLEACERSALRRAVGDVAVAVEPQVVPGHPARTLMAEAEPQDVLVVGSRGRGGFAGLLLGSTSSQVAQHAPCPVVVVREQ